MGYGYYTPEERRLRWLVGILLVAVVVLSVVLVSRCDNRTQEEEVSWYDWEDDDEDGKGQNENEKAPLPYQSASTSLRGNLERVMNSNGVMRTNPGEKYEEWVLRNYPELNPDNHNGLGGAKLLGEMNADANGKKKSASPNGDETPWRPPQDLGLDIDDSPNGLPSRIRNREVKATPSPVRVAGFLSGYFYLDILIENLSGIELDVVIRRGLLLESLGYNVQNIVVKESVMVRLRAYERRTVRLTAYCASQYRSDPSGYSIRITPFMLTAESSVFRSQTAVWDWQRNIYAGNRRYLQRTTNVLPPPPEYDPSKYEYTLSEEDRVVDEYLRSLEDD